jgi:hypothetical protein
MKRSIAGVAQRAKRQETKDVKGAKKGEVPTLDSFVNFAQRLGIGAENALSTSSYGFNPITRVRTQLEWIHRGSWLGGVAVDVVAEDMTRAGVSLKGSLKPDQIEMIEEAATTLSIWPSLKETIQWARLYGGAIAVMMIDGQKPETPLRIETVGKGQFKGLLVLDRWMVEPTLNDLVTEMGPDMGLPKFYNVTADAPALPRLKVHHSRCIRLEGIRLPYWQRVMENLWGISVIERLYDRMVAFDSATTGAAQLVYKCYLRTLKVKNLREVVAAGGDIMNGLVAQFDLMRRYQGMEGITLIDGDDEFGINEHSAFGGLAEVLQEFGQQLSGALQIPLVRLFGQSPSGFSSGDNDVRLYYDGIASQQNKDLKIGVTKVYRMIAQSEGVKVPNGFSIGFNPLWQLQDKEKAEISSATADSVIKARDAGLVSDKCAMQELRQSANITGIFSNITDKDIREADDVPEAPEPIGLSGAEVEQDDPPLPKGKKDKKDPADKDEKSDRGASGSKAKKPAKDHADTSMKAISDILLFHDLHIAIENPKGSIRQGGAGETAWQVSMPEDYGYIRRTEGADGDQVDCYVGPYHESPTVYVIDQNNPDTGEFDEHKVMLGFPSKRTALQAYEYGYTDGRVVERFRSCTEMSMESFKQWLNAADLTKPCEG